MADAPPGSLAAAVDQAALSLAQDAPSAERQARAILARVPNDPRALLILASARRRQGDAGGARTILEPLAKAFPRAANTHYELGASLADLGDPGAKPALRHAVGLNPDLAEAWRTLGDLLFREGDLRGAEAAFAEHSRASVTDPALKTAAAALYGGRLSEAEALLRRHIADRPNELEPLRLLAETYLRQMRLAAAEGLLARCLELAPGHDGMRFSYASALFRQQRAAEAMPHVERLMARDPKHPAYRNLYAGCLGLIGEDERVIEVTEALARDYAGQPHVWLSYGHALRAVGRQDEAVAAYRKAISMAPGLGDAYWSLANLKVASFGAGDEAAIAAQLGRGDLAAEDRLHLHYALGKALEDRKDFAGSFAHYAQGAAIRKAEAPYDAAAVTALADRSQAVLTAGFFAARAGGGAPSQAPIFIVGLPRSGSTLVEQILASHSAVEGTMELPYVEHLAFELAGVGRAEPGRPYPDCLEALAPARLAELGERYLSQTLVHRKLGRPMFVDKMPNNFQHIGLIQLMLPNARIIDARRHPLGTCFSCFKQHFAEGQTFTYDLTDLGRYYRDYVRLMDHFDQVLPGRVHRVIYEDMVENTEAEIRRLLDYCGLEFEAPCLRFWETDRSVRTVSSEQVRRPIYRGGLDQWRAYEPWLGPLKAALGPVLEDWRGRPKTKPASAERTAEVNQVRQAPLSQA
ncbi:tetratricopeptide repeat-containing sulfotransferase family protein [Phenylobacterium montanum]|uniref:Sulfotransferase n=1 Tax=Phenylobacterium montanum TaxID=2823693 RepID=A0A975IVI9_9CAUL|nr:tetratricopeptide repeat-containing sulfotransferase family protein [Caulobacter sp. S6]QUD87376.1 sulfotransferase [Caulobacter sp. S6]